MKREKVEENDKETKVEENDKETKVKGKEGGGYNFGKKEKIER